MSLAIRFAGYGSRVSKASGTSPNGKGPGRVPSTRISWTWVSLIVAVVLGIALVDFLVQNTRSTEIEFFSISGHVPLTAALLVAALAGAAVVLVIGVARIIQLRRGLRGSSATKHNETSPSEKSHPAKAGG